MNGNRLVNLTVSAAAGLAVVGGVVFASMSDANAAFKLRLISGATTIIVSDNDVAGQPAAVPNTGDADPTVGVISFSGVVGGFTTVVSVGVTKPAPSNPAFPPGTLLDFMNIDVSSGPAGGGTLTAELTDTGYSAGSSDRFVTTISGLNTSGSVALTSAVDINDAEFASVLQVGNIPALGPGFGLSGKSFASAPIDAAYSVSLLATVTHASGFQSTSFTARVQVPEPRTLALFGIGLMGLGLLWRRRSRALAKA